jgi:hypothetical protein
LIKWISPTHIYPAYLSTNMAATIFCDALMFCFL